MQEYVLCNSVQYPTAHASCLVLHVTPPSRHESFHRIAMVLILRKWLHSLELDLCEMSEPVGVHILL